MKRTLLIITIVCVITSMIFSACNALEGYGRTQVTWFVGLGSGSTEPEIKVEREVVDEFNKSQDKIWLVLEVVPTSNASDVLASEIASGRGPDVVGPMGSYGANIFYGQWLDMAPYIQESNDDGSVLNKDLVKLYQTEEGQVGMPFAVYPAVVFYNKKMFDRASLAYPPAGYGEKYRMPDGTQMEWSWDALTQVARLLTLDTNGKNSTQAGFDRKSIIQYGYYSYNFPPYIGTFWGADSFYKKVAGKPVARIPKQWVAAWKWYFDGMWGAEPFIPIGLIAQDTNKSAGDPFSYGITAMGVAQLWYLCCIHLADNWDIAALPSYQGVVHGRVDVDTIRILKSSKNPAAAFEVMKYLIGPVSTRLLAAYNGMPTRTADQKAFFDTQKKQFPSVTNWQVAQAGLAYPDIPSADAYTPNRSDVSGRFFQFAHLIATDDSINFDNELKKLEVDLETIFNEK